MHAQVQAGCDLAEHEAEELGQPPGLWEDGPHLLPRLQPLPQPVVPPLCTKHSSPLAVALQGAP